MIKNGSCEVVKITPAFVKEWYEVNPDTNAFTDKDKTKLDSLTNKPGADGKDGVDGLNGTDGINGKDGLDGQQGIPGNEGPRGLDGHDGKDGANVPTPGPKGDKGSKGDRGIPGIAGTNGTNGVDGTDGAGFKGDKGDQGDRGLQGTQGPIGHIGTEGPRGPKGIDGQSGQIGNTGPKGPKGDSGKDGTGVSVKGSDTKAKILAKSGAVGDMWIITDVGAEHGQGLVSNGNGSGIANWTNVGNIAGPKGDTGANGIDGKAGIPGASGPVGPASTVAGPSGGQGPVGPKGSDSTVAGPKGAKGDPGQTGPIGMDGPQGTKGLDGTDGTNGKDSTVAGPKGKDGKDGINGVKGDTGIQGIQGARGPKGDTGLQGPKGNDGAPGSGGLDPADQAKLDAIQVGTNSMTLDKNEILVGDGTKAVGIKLHNPATEEAILQGDGSKGAWYVGSFPKSTIHPDDLVLSNSTGGLFTSIADGAKWSVRYGSDIVSFTKAELQAVKSGGGLDPADKTKLDFIAATKDANLDTMGDNIQVAFNRINDLGLDASGSNLMSTDEIELSSTQVVPTSPALALASNRLMTIGSVFKALNDFKTVIGNTYEAILGKPTKDDQILSSKKDGTRSWIDAPSGGSGVAPVDQTKLNHISVTKDVDLDNMATMDDISSVGGLAQFDYKLKVGAADTTPVSGKISFDNADPAKATKLYIHKQDRRHTDMSLFLAGINVGDYFNIHDNNNVNDFVAFDVIGKSVQTGDIFMVPVKFYDNNGTLTDKERVFVHWQRDMAIPNNLVVGDRTGEAQVTLDAKTGDASHVVFKRDGVAKSSIGVIASNNDELVIEQRANDDVRFIIPAGNAIVAKIGTEFKTVSFTEHLHGTTVPADTLGSDGDVYFRV